MKVAIIGSGPAGAMAAVRLARAGASVTLFDPTHPREKPCGGGLTGRALALLGDAIDIGALPAVVVKSATVQAPERAARVPLSDRGATPASSLLVISRSVFDRALTDAARGAGALLVRERAMSVSARRSRMIVTTGVGGEYEVDFVLGADGANSIVRKQLARPFSRAELSVSAGYFVSGATADDIVIETTRERPGYLWSFPRPDHLAVGICGPAGLVTSVELRRQSAAWIRQHDPHRDSPLTPYAWPIPSIGATPRKEVHLSGAGWMLLGDAAGLVDPLTREGIFYALLSGHMAAEALESAPPSRASVRYSEAVLGGIQPELARAAQLSHMFFNPAFSSLLVRGLEESAEIRDVFVDLVGGVQPYRGLRRRLLATLRWSLAARAIPMLLGPSITGTMTGVALPPGNATRS